MSSQKIAIALAQVSSALSVAIAALPEAQQNEAMVVGQFYNIKIGRPQQVVQAALVAQRVNDKGIAEFRFTYGEGFEQRFYDLTASFIVDANGEPIKSAADLQAKIERLTEKKAKLTTELAQAEAAEQLVDGQTYNIRVGRGDTSKVVPAVLLGQGAIDVPAIFDDAGVEIKGAYQLKRYKFFYGAGFDAEVVVVAPSQVVVEEVAPNADNATEPVTA